MSSEHQHDGSVGAGHDFYEHVKSLYPTLMAEGQEHFGGYSYVSANEIVARSPITGLRPVIDQAIAQVKAAKPNLEGLALESAIANKLTNLNDWANLTTATQNLIMIQSGIDFGSMSKADQEKTINHLLHSPLAFGEIQEVLSSDTTIYLSYTHTLDKAKTTAEHMGDGVYKVSMISNNNNGSHTGHVLGSFYVDVNGDAAGAGSGLESLAIKAANAMVVNTNDNNKLYLADAARDVLYGRDAINEEGSYDDTGMYIDDHGASEGFGSGHQHGGDTGEGVGAGHSFVEHVKSLYPDLLADDQTAYGGYTWISENEIVARAPITGLLPVIEQAIAQVKKAQPNLTGQALESEIAQQLTNLNDWANLTKATQNKIMIMSQIDFGSMTAAEQEASINHLLHSPLPFGSISEVLDADVKIFMEFTHTLDKDKTTAEHLGDGLYKINLISNNNNGSHTGHNLGSFVVDMSDYGLGQWGVSGTASSSYSAGASYSVNAALGAANAGNSAANSKVWMAKSQNSGEQWLELDYASAVNAVGVNIHENYGGGFVTRIELKDDDGNYHTVWSGDDNTAAGRVLSVKFDQTDFMTKTVRVTVDTSGSGWEGIDAIELMGENPDGTGLEAAAIEIGNDMVVNTNDNNQLYLDQTAQNVLYGTDYDKGQSEDGYSTGSDGSGEEPQVKEHVHGNSTEFTWKASDDGKYLLLTKSATGAETKLPAKVILMFHDKEVDTSDLFEGQGGGEGSDNVYVIDGDSEDWGWDLTEDGQGVVVWSENDFMILDAKVVLKFNDKDVDTSSLFEGGGGEEENVFVVDGNSSDWGWGLTDDESGIVLWSDNDFHILEAKIVIRFNDMDVDTADMFEGGGEEGDILELAGNASDYGWGPTEDNSAVVVWKEDFFEIVEIGTRLKFDDQTVDTGALFESEGESADENGESGSQEADDYDESDDVGEEDAHDHSSHEHYEDMVA